jgi:hypothetical protein
LSGAQRRALRLRMEPICLPDGSWDADVGNGLDL